MNKAWDRTIGDAARALMLAASAVFLVQCASGPEAEAPSHKPGLYGSFLAGRYATQKRDSGAAANFFGDALRMDPGNPLILERALVSDVARGDVDEAATHAEDLLKKAPESRLAKIVIAVKLFRDGKFAEARGYFSKLEGKQLAELANRLGSAWSYLAEGNAAEAQKVAAGLVAADDLSAFAALHKGLIEEIAGRDAAASRSYAAAYKASEGGTLRVVQLYGAFLERLGEKNKARAIYQDYLKESPDHPLMSAALAALDTGPGNPRLVTTPPEGLGEVFYSMASALNEPRTVDLSIFYVQLALSLNAKNELAQTLLGDRLQTAGRCPDAIGVFKRIEASSPIYHNARMQIADCYGQLDKIDAAVEAYELAIDGTRNDVETYAAWGDLLREKERYQDAERIYSKSIDRLTKPAERHWVVFYTRGIARERLKLWSDAERDLKKALELKPEQPQVMNYLAYTWVEQGVNMDQALAMLHKAVEKKEDDGYIVDSLGWAYYKRGDFAKAVLFLEQAIALVPGESTINDHLGDAYWRVGRMREAQFQWQHALKLKPEAQEIPRIERKLRDGLDVVEASERQGTR